MYIMTELAALLIVALAAALVLRVLKDSSARKAAESYVPFEADGLGTITFNPEDCFWETSAASSGMPFVFRFDGGDRPNEEHFAHAKEIKANLAAFQDMIRGFLIQEANNVHEDNAAEILSLEVESVCLWVPGRPADGMIYFEGPDEFRVWRCDYIDRKPRLLGFDS